MSGGVWGVSGGSLEDVRGVLWCLGVVRRCLGGVLDTFSDPGTLGPPGTYRNPGPCV